MPSKIIQITDLHLFADPAARLMGIPTRETLADVLQDIQHKHPDLDRLVVTGDHTHDELPQTYHDLSQILAPWNDRQGQLLQIPGNHDDRKLIQQVFPQTDSGMGSRVTFCTTLGQWKLIGLDSHREGEVAGHIEQEQLDWLQQTLAKNPKQPTALFIHHPPCILNSVWMDAIGIDNVSDLVAIIEQAEQIQLICAGHVHHEFETTIGNARLYTTPSTGLQFNPQGDVPTFTDLAPGYRVITLDGDHYQTYVERLSEVRFKPMTEEK